MDVFFRIRNAIMGKQKGNEISSPLTKAFLSVREGGVLEIPIEMIPGKEKRTKQVYLGNLANYLGYRIKTKTYKNERGVVEFIFVKVVSKDRWRR
jgi:hypothetical protein